MSYRALIRSAAALLRESGVEDAEVDASLLLSHLTGRPALSLRLDTDGEPDAATQAAFDALLRRRVSREPLQYLLHTQPFYGRSFYVDERVLIPRPETELLCERAVALLRARPAQTALDLCCGSGCLAVTMALEVPGTQVIACDLSADALQVAQQNARQLGANVTFCQGDLWDAVPETRFDVIVSNPPYIASGELPGLQQEVRREPAMALDGGTDGLCFYRRIAEKAARFLRPGGTLLLEIGQGQAEDVARLLTQAGLTAVRVDPDYNDIPRVAQATLPEPRAERNHV